MVTDESLFDTDGSLTAEEIAEIHEPDVDQPIHEVALRDIRQRLPFTNQKDGGPARERSPILRFREYLDFGSCDGAFAYFCAPGQEPRLNTDSLQLCETMVPQEADRNIRLAFTVRNRCRSRLV